MFEITPLAWKTVGRKGSIPCFIRGCHHEARHVAKIRHGNIVFQICLCDQCLHKSTIMILDDLGVVSGKKHNEVKHNRVC